MSQHEVAVIGAGPAGVSVALSLRDRGVYPLLIDRATKRFIVGRKKKPVTATIAATGLVGLAAWAAVSVQGNPGKAPVATTAASGISASADRGNGAGPNRADPRTYIVLFREAPLASFRGGLGIASPRDPRSNRLNARSRAAQDYVRYLQNRQRNIEGQLARAIGRPLDVTMRMQHAVNGIVTVMSPAEAARMAKQPDVLLVEASRDYPLDTDTGPGLIGAKTLWSGVPDLSGAGKVSARGEGVIVGIIDTGINYASPSFAATDPYDGYVHSNPNGSGNYLGTCAPGGVVPWVTRASDSAGHSSSRKWRSPSSSSSVRGSPY